MISLPGRGDHIDLDSDCCGVCSKQSAQLARLARGNLAVLLASKERAAYRNEGVTAQTWRQLYFAVRRLRAARRAAGDPVPD